MIITNLRIKNFRNYSDEVNLDLQIDDSHNIILFGGQNGAGKTSMVDAIRLCLYGNRLNGYPLSDSKYQQFLQGVINKDSDGTMYVVLEILMNEENPQISINIERRFKRASDKIEEELILRRAGTKLEFIDHDYWSYYVEKIIPPASSRYFFFDGEKVRDIISSESSKNYLSEAIDNLTGIASLRVLKNDLSELRKRIINKTRKTELEKISVLKNSINSLLEEIMAKKAIIEKNNDELTKLSKDRDELEDERSRLVGSTNEKRTEYNSRLKECNSSLDESNRVISDFCYSNLPFFLARSAIYRTVKQAEAENANVIYQYSITAIKELADNPEIESILGLSKRESNDVLKRIIEQLSTNVHETERSLDISLTKAEQMKNAIPDFNEVDSFVDNVRNRDYYLQEVAKYRKKLDKLTDDSIKGIDTLLSELNIEIEVIKRQNENESDQIKALDNRLSNLRSDLAREERLLVMEDVDRESVKNIDLVMENIDKRVSIIMDDARRSMEKKINEIYHVLKNTKDMVKRIVLSEQFEIHLIDFENKEVDTEYISEGEKGILMYSTVFALHSISNSIFPLIVDSPLGRMDTKHVHNLAEKYFPSIPSQIVLLSHDREVVGESLDILQKNIKHKYLIRKNDSPKIINGYFE